MFSLEELTPEALDAALDDYLRSSISGDGLSLSEKGQAEMNILLRLCAESGRMKGALEILVRLAEKNNLSPSEVIDFVFREGFVLGWKLRGAILYARLREDLHSGPSGSPLN